MRVISDIPSSSHHTWRDKDHVLLFVNGSYRLIRDNGLQKKKKILWKATNGHQTYLKNNKDWIITDTYPNKNNLQHVYLRKLKNE